MNVNQSYQTPSGLPCRSAPTTHRRHQFEHLEARLPLSVTLLNEPFDDDAVDTLPNTADFSANASGPEGFIQVGGPGGAYGTPIIPAGNKSLVFDNPGQAQPLIVWIDEFSDDPSAFQSGRVSFDVFMPEPTGSRDWTYLDFRLGYGDANRTSPTTINDTTIWNSFRVNRASPDIVFDNGNGGGSAPISSQATLRVEYLIDGPTRTYQLLIDGTPISFGSSASRPWMPGAAGINMLAFVGAFPLSSMPVAIDNLQVVQADDVLPEPWTPPAGEPTSQLEWYQHRGNKRLTGRAEIDTNIVDGATVLWSQFIGARESWVALEATPGNSRIELPRSNQSLAQGESVSWDIGGPYFDLDGTGSLSAQSTGSLRIVGDFIPDNGVLELLEGEVLDTTFGQGVIRLFTRSGGAWVEQWESPTIPAMFGIPNLLAGDFDNDGSLEVALTPWTNLYLLDMQTGQVEETAAFKPAANESGRPYGWLGAYDMNDDLREEIVVMGDFQDFISVMGWDAGGNLVKLWDHVFEPQLASKQTTHRPVAFPVRDITGDGNLEIATSIYNETDDGRWHLRVFDALTGTPLHDLVDHAIDGARDVNGDGDYELFVRETTGPLLPASGTVKILDYNGNGFDAIWSQANARFVSQDLSDFPLHVSSATATGKLDLLTGPAAPGGEQIFFTRQTINAAAATFQIETWQWDSEGNISQLASATGPNLDAIAVRDANQNSSSILLAAEVFGDSLPPGADFNSDEVVDGSDIAIWEAGFGTLAGAAKADGDADSDGVVNGHDFLIWQRSFGLTSDPSVLLTGASGQSVYSAGSAPPRASAVVGRLDGPASTPTVVVQGASENIAAFQPDGDGSINSLWGLPGIGGSNGASQFTGQHEFSGVALGDVTGNGQLETLFATVGDAGQARLVAVTSSGSEVWHTDFEVPGGPRVFNEPGLTLWRTGNFTTLDYQDVLVQTMRGSGGTGEFHLLHGQTGALIWRRTFGNTPGSHAVSRAAGEAHLAVYDWDNDGLDEAVNFHPDMYYVVDGNGANLVDAAVVGGGVFPGGSPLYGAPIVDDFLNNGTDTVLWAGSYSQLGLITKNGADIWHTPFVFDDTPGFIQGVGDVDGNGTLELLSPGHPISPGVDTSSLFRAIDAATGALLWSVSLPGRAFAPVGGAYSNTPTTSISADVDQDGRDESIFAISNTLYAVGADPGGNSGSIEWTFTPDSGLLSSPIVADANGDGIAEIIVVSTSGNVYGIGVAAPAAAAQSDPTEPHAPRSFGELAIPIFDIDQLSLQLGRRRDEQAIEVVAIQDAPWQYNVVLQPSIGTPVGSPGDDSLSLVSRSGDADRTSDRAADVDTALGDEWDWLRPSLTIPDLVGKKWGEAGWKLFAAL